MCINVPYAPGARAGHRGGMPFLPPPHTGSRGGIVPAHAAPPLACSTPSDMSSPCGGVLVATARAAEAAVSVFKEAKRSGAWVPRVSCTCAAAASSSAPEGQLAGQQAGPSALRLCAQEGLVLPYAPERAPPSPLEGYLRASGNHSCAAHRCVRWPEAAVGSSSSSSSGSGGEGEQGPTLADFGPAAVDRVTFAQAVYLARRAEALAHAWTAWGNAGGGGEGAMDSQVRQAVYAGTGPMLTLLNMCGCANHRL